MDGNGRFWLSFWLILAIFALLFTFIVSQPDLAQVEAAKRWSPKEYQCVYGSFASSADRQYFCANLPTQVKEHEND